MEQKPISPPVSVVAVDFGEARIGIAASDSLGLLAHPLETVPAQPRQAAFQRIAEICRNRQAELLVMGLPVRADGEEGKAAATVRRFAQALQEHLSPGLPIHFQDEYRSTVEAAARLHEAGRKSKHHRPVIDQAAAVVILQEYLDSLPDRCPLLTRPAGEDADPGPAMQSKAGTE